MTKTREDILAMPAGRDLDALVAEKVMGFPNVHKFYHRYVYDNVGSLGSVMGRVDVKEYSTDMSAASEIVLDFKVVRIYNHQEVTKGLWEVSFVSNDTEFKQTAYAKSLPEAICKAALLAVLEETK